MTLVSMVSTFFGCGRFPIAPGTVASAVTLVLCIPLDAYLGWPGPAGLVVVACLAGWASAGTAAREAGVTDPGFVVIDEVAGMAIAVLGASGSIMWMVAAFFMFRLLDIWKPWPVRAVEQLPGSTGIMMDDILAGGMAALLIGCGRLVSGM